MLDVFPVFLKLGWKHSVSSVSETPQPWKHTAPPTVPSDDCTLGARRESARPGGRRACARQRQKLLMRGFLRGTGQGVGRTAIREENPASKAFAVVERMRACRLVSRSRVSRLAPRVQSSLGTVGGAVCFQGCVSSVSQTGLETQCF